MFAEYAGADTVANGTEWLHRHDKLHNAVWQECSRMHAVKLHAINTSFEHRSLFTQQS